MINNLDFINKTIHWDCIVEMDKLIEKGLKVDLIIIDPPYEIEANGWGTINNVMKLNKSFQDWIVKENLHKWYDYEKVLNRLDKLQDKINIYIFCSKNQIPLYINRYVNEKKCVYNFLFWHKNNALPTYSNKYLSDCEYILHFRKWAKCHPETYEDAQTVYFWSINKKDKKEWEHPTIKPLELIEKLIRNSSNEWDLVLDCFAWSWTTWVACKNLKRNYLMIEEKKQYIDIIHKRLEL
jgi:site-specific DNA-methyltransferase (adenine-specific)